MKKNCVISVLCVWLLCAQATAQTTEVEEQQARTRLLTMMQSFHYLQAPIVQITHGRRNSRSEGTLAVAKPNRVMIQMSSPQKQLLLADGRFVWHVRYALKQVVRRTFAHNHRAFGLLADLDQRKALSYFSISERARQECMTIFTELSASKTTHTHTQDGCFILKPLEDEQTAHTHNPEYVVLYFVHQSAKGTNEATWQLQAMRFTTSLGSITDLYLQLPLDYRPIDEQIFIFTPQPEFDLITDE